MKHRSVFWKGTVAAVSCALCVPVCFSQSLTASGGNRIGEPVCYTITETPAGWRYADAEGNLLEEQLIPFSRLQNRAGTAEQSSLPARYDLREEGLVTSVKQQFGGTCWAYGAFGAIESNMIKKGMGDTSLDLSEAHLIWFSRGQGGPADPSSPLHGDGVNLGIEAYKQGGGLYWVTAALAAWEGVVYESDAPSHMEEQPMDESLRFRSAAHLQNMRKFSSQDAQAVKETLMEKGALGFSYFIPSGVECVSEKCGFYQTLYDPDDPEKRKASGGGHTVTLVGWDDNFPKENFIETPPGDGAWILKNSWGSSASRTEKGFFYLSYYDKGIGDITLFDMEPADNYSGIYQYDGDSDKSYLTGRGSDAGFLQANVFEAKQNESITAVGFYINDVSVPFEVTIYRLYEDFTDPQEGTLLTEITGFADYIGYYTVPLRPGVGVRKGSHFSVVVRTAPRARTSCHFDKHCFAPRTSYFTTFDSFGDDPWIDCYDAGRGNVNVKAYAASGTVICHDLYPEYLIWRNLAEEYDGDESGYVSEEEFAAAGGVPYDINGDGKANALDLTLLKRAALGLQETTQGYHWYRADLNKDGYLNMDDVQIMLRFLLGEPEPADDAAAG